MNISSLFIVVVFICYAETYIIYYEILRETFSKSRGSSDLDVSVWLPGNQSYSDYGFINLSLICNTSGVDGEIWWAKDEVNLTEPLEAKNGSEIRTALTIDLKIETDAGDFTCVANTTEGTFLKKTVHIGKIKPPRMISSLRIHDVLVNESVTLTCDVEGYPLPILYWDTRHTARRWKNMTKLTYINETYVRISIDFESIQHEDEAKYYCGAEDYDGNSVRSYNYLKVNDDPVIECELVFPFGMDKLNFKIPNTIDIEDMIDPIFEYLKDDAKEWRIHTMTTKFGRDGYVVSGLESSAWYKFRISFLNYPKISGPVYYKWVKPLGEEPEFVPTVWIEGNTLTSIKIVWTSPPLEMQRYVHQYKAIAIHRNNKIGPVYLPKDVNSYIFENLESETSYLIKVAACGKYKTQCGNWSLEREVLTIKNELQNPDIYNQRSFVSDKEAEILIWSSLTVAALSIIVGTWIGFRKRRREASRRKMMEAALERFNAGALNCLNPELNITDQAELLPYNKKWEFPRELLKLDKILGSGAFGIVRKAHAQSISRPETVTTVAVKLVRATARLNYMMALDRELKILGYLGKHLNVVNLLGACTQNINYGELLVIVEFCRFGNLRDYLIRRRDDFISQIDTTSAVTIAASLSASGDTSDNTQNSTDQNVEVIDSDPVTDAIEPIRLSKYQGDYNDEDLEPIETRDLICWIWQVSRGMKFLGSRRVIHGDLAARNILLADHNVVKICDFGMAKALQADEDYKKKGHDPLPVKWMAIESLRDRVFSYQSDIWSFGIVLWEFFSLGATPYPGIDPGSLYQKLKDGFRMERPKYATAVIYYMMQFCWDAEPARRPSFEKLEDILVDLLDESVRMHYLDLSLPYVRINDDAFSHGEKDYLTMTPSEEATINGTRGEIP